MPRSSSHNHHKSSSRSYSRDKDRDYKKRDDSSDEDNYYDRKKSSYRSPSSSSRSKTNYKSSSRRRSRSSSGDDYYRKKSSKSYSKDKKSKHSKRSNRSPSTESSSSSSPSESSGSVKSVRSYKQENSKRTTPSVQTNPNEFEIKPSYDLKLLEGKINSEIIDDIESDKFQQKTFTSSKQPSGGNTTSQKLYIDLKKETITVPTSNESKPVLNDSLYHPDFLGDEMEKLDKWAKKLFTLRQRIHQDA